MVLFEGDQIREGGLNPLAYMVRGRTKSASGFGPAGPNPRRTKSASTPAVVERMLPILCCESEREAEI